MRDTIQVVPEAEALAHVAADDIVAAGLEAVRARGTFIIALSGGTTPRRTFERLSSEPFASQMPWSRVQVLWGDERCVPPDDPASNYRMAREALLDRVPVPAGNVLRIRGEDGPRYAAAQYESQLRALLHTPDGPPRAIPGARIDLVLLGVGTDGHTASLFPGSPAVHEHARWVAVAYSAETSMWRVTLTPPILNTAAEVLFLVSGLEKADIVRQVLEGPRIPDDLPAQIVAPIDGRVRWLIDAEAASQLGSASPTAGRRPS